MGPSIPGWQDEKLQQWVNNTNYGRQARLFKYTSEVTHVRRNILASKKEKQVRLCLRLHVDGGLPDEAAVEKRHLVPERIALELGGLTAQLGLGSN